MSSSLSIIYLHFIERPAPVFVAYLEPKLPSCLGGKPPETECLLQQPFQFFFNSPIFFFFSCDPQWVSIEEKGKKQSRSLFWVELELGTILCMSISVFFSFFGYQNFGEISPKYSKISQIHTCKT